MNRSVKRRTLINISMSLRNDMSKTVIACARLATKYKYFGIQYYGECWAGNEETYYLSGTSTECYMGTGREFVNYVYSFNGPVSKYANKHT